MPEDIDNVGELLERESDHFEAMTDKLAVEAVKNTDELTRSSSPEGILYDKADVLRKLIIDAQDKNIRTRLFHRTPRYGRVIEGFVPAGPNNKGSKLSTVSLMPEMQVFAEGNVELGWQIELRAAIDTYSSYYEPFDYTKSDVWIMRAAQWRDKAEQQSSEYFATIYMGSGSYWYLRPHIDRPRIAQVDNVDRWALGNAAAYKAYEQLHTGSFEDRQNQRYWAKQNQDFEKLLDEGEKHASSFDLRIDALDFMTNLVTKLTIEFESLGRHSSATR